MQRKPLYSLYAKIWWRVYSLFEISPGQSDPVWVNSTQDELRKPHPVWVMELRNE